MAESEHMIRVRIIVSGRVQGVFFRAGARDEASSLGIVGFARNEPDGSVLIEAEGTPQAIGQFREWCAAGPARAEVEHVDVSRLSVTGEREFMSS